MLSEDGKWMWNPELNKWEPVKQKKNKSGAIVVLFVLALLFGGCAALVGNVSSNTPQTTTTVVSTPVDEVKPKTETETTVQEVKSIGDGTHIVGENIEPGTYQASGGELCYWERLSGFSGEFNDIISNGLGSSVQVVEIKDADAGFTSSGCGEWEKLS